MKRIFSVSFLALAMSLALSAQDFRHITIATVPDHHTPLKHWAWIGSMGFLAAGQFMDYQSSLGKHEANPLIGNSGGSFNSSRGLSLKLAIVGGMIGSQVLVHHFARNHNADVMFSGANTMLGSIGMVTAIHNYGVPKASK